MRALENLGLGIGGQGWCSGLLLLWDGYRSMSRVLWHDNRKEIAGESRAVTRMTLAEFGPRALELESTFHVHVGA